MKQSFLIFSMLALLTATTACQQGMTGEEDIAINPPEVTEQDTIVETEETQDEEKASLAELVENVQLREKTEFAEVERTAILPEPVSLAAKPIEPYPPLEAVLTPQE